MTDDELLRQYVMEGSEDAFAELVRCHLALVHSAALRQMHGDCQLAKDVTQAVFSELARKASRLVGHRALSGWLYTTARFIAARVQRKETRRASREAAYQAMNEVLQQFSPDPTWKDLQPFLDEAMGELREQDRYAIVLRFFENKPLAEVGARLRLSENAARMRLDRAIEKLRLRLAQRGIKSSTSVLAALLAANAVVPAPTTLAAALIGPALAGAVVCSGASSTITLSLFHLMNSAKIGMSVTALAMASTVVTYVAMDRANATLRSELRLARIQEPASNAVARVAESANTSLAENEELARLRAEHGELIRLRGEVGILRRAQEELTRLRAEQAAQDRANAEKAVQEKVRKAVEELAGAKMNFTVPWAKAFQAFALAHRGEMPESFDQAVPFIPAEVQSIASSFPTGEFEILFRGSLEDLREPARTIILREKQPFNVQPNGESWRTYLFADGHSEIHIASDGNFEPWERERGVALPQ